MDAALPHADDPDEFHNWLLDRLSVLADITLDRGKPPVHTSYEDWNFSGTLLQNPTLQKSGPTSPVHTGPAVSVRPSLTRLPSRDSNSRITEKIQSKVTVRVSRHLLRLERQYQSIKQLSALDPVGDQHVRALQLLRLQPHEGRDEPVLAVLVMENSGPKVGLRSLLNYGPNYFTIERMPPQHLYDPTIASDGSSKTGNTSVNTFLKFALGAAKCCALLHDNKMVHGEIRPDAFLFDTETGSVKWVNHGSGIRAFENGLQSSHWASLSRSYGISFKLQFVAPEQTGRLSAAPDQRTDIYSLGQVFFLLLTGSVPFDGLEAIETLQNVLNRRAPLVSARRDGLPQALTAIISKMTQRNIEERYHSIQGLIWDLKQISTLFQNSLVSQDTGLDDFVPGEGDENNVFRVSEAQIGRHKERKQILSILENFRLRHQQLRNVYARRPKTMTDLDGSPEAMGVLAHRTFSTDTLQSSSASERSISTSSLQLSDNVRSSEIPQNTGISAAGRRSPFERILASDEGSTASGAMQNRTSGEFGSLGGVTSPSVLSSDTPLSVHSSRGTQRLNRHSRTEIVNIFGVAGLGKSTLIASVLGDIRKHGLVAATKFDSENNVPFQSMIKLMANLFRQIFMDSSNTSNFHNELEAFVRPIWPTLSHALGLPHDLLGPQSYPEPDTRRRQSVSIQAASASSFMAQKTLGAGRCRKATEFLRTGTASKSSRLQAMFISVLRFLAKSQPIVFILEDIENADAESIELIASILQSRTLLTMIFTCRTRDDVSPPISRILSSPNAKVTSIELAPLSEDETAQIVGNTLHRSSEYCFPLAAVAVQRTQGVPFALKTFLEECYKQKFIWYCWNEKCWNYDFEKSFEFFASPTVRRSDDFILERLQDLPSNSRKFLAFACFLGTPFRFSLVKRLMQTESEDSTNRTKPRSNLLPDLVRRSSQDAIKGLETLLAASVLTETDEDDLFEFCHSRYRFAAKRLEESKDKEAMCFQISKVIVQETIGDDDPFFKARYICAASKLIREFVPERKLYRSALLQAAGMCTESDSKATAYKYLSSALNLLQENPWTDDGRDRSYSETLLLHIRAAEAFSNSKPDAAVELLEKAIQHAKNVFDRTPACLLLGRIRVQSGQMDKSFQILKQALSDLGVNIPETTWVLCDAEFLRLKEEIDALDPVEFENRVVSDDNSLTAVGEVIAEALSSAFWTDSLACYQLTEIFARSTLEQGITNHSGLALSQYGSAAVGRWDLVSLGVKLNQIAECHFSRFDDDYATGRGLGVNALQTGWLHRHVRELVPKCDVAMERSLNANDRNGALMNGSFGAMMRIWSSWDMAEVEAFGVYVSELIPWDKDRRGGILLTGATQFARAMQGKTQAGSAETIFTDNSHHTESYLDWGIDHAAPTKVKNAYAGFLIPALYVFGYVDRAIEVAERDIIPTLAGYFAARVRAQGLFYISMAYLASDSGDEQKKVEFAKQALQKLLKWSEVSDINLLAWTSLISAALHEREGQYHLSLQTYETALDHCEVHNFFFELAMIYEHYGEFLIRRGANRLARNALRDASAAYKRISAHGKAAHIAKKHEWLLKGTTSLNVVDAGCQTIGPVDACPDAADVFSDDHDHSVLSPVPTRGQASGARTSDKDDADLNTLGLDVVDISNILESSQVLSSTLQIDQLLAKMADIMRSSASAELAAIIIKKGKNEWNVAAVSDSSGKKLPVGDSLEKVGDAVGKYIIMYGIRFRETIFVESTAEDERFSGVGHIDRERRTEKSVFTAPIIHGTEILGAIYVECPPHSFTQRNLTVLRALLPSVSISIANANLFEKLEKSDAKNKVMIGAQREALAQARAAEAKAKEARQEALENLRQKEEAAKAKSLFLANTSHELRTPLNGVIGMSELLKSSKLAPEQESYCDSIRVCADTLLQVINDILDFSKLEAGKLQLYAIPVSLHETIVEVVRALSFSNREKKVETITDLAFSEDLVVTSDPVRLHQVLMNILSNAYKFTSEGSVTVKGVIEEDTAKDIKVVISITDTGIGIDEVARKKLFMPFSQADSGTSRAYGGTGLGLSICKAIIENAMEGKIWLDSEPGVGTTVSFQLTLPKVVSGRGASSENVPRANPMKVFTPDDERERELRQPTRDLSVLSRDEIRIAIAEDNMVNQRIARKYVAKLGYSDCEAFNDGAACVEGLEKANKEGKPFAIVLMDCQMPRLDGYDATRLIRKHEDQAIREVIIIAMTASAIRGDREKCLEAGMSAYLAKPVKQDMLKRMIDSYVSPRSPVAVDEVIKPTNGSINGTLQDGAKATKHLDSTPKATTANGVSRSMTS